MSIQSVTDVTKAPAMPVPVVASGAEAAVPAVGATASEGPAKGKSNGPVHVNIAVPSLPPPPPPSKGFNMNVEIGEHAATKTKTYSFVDPDSGETVVQIPVDKVLNLVASILQQLESQGKM